MSAYEFDGLCQAGSAGACDLERSTAIVVDKEIVGAMMVSGQLEESCYKVPAQWVHEDYRGDWVNAVLIHNSVQHCVPLGLKTVRFVANRGKARNTVRLAGKLEGELVRSLQRLERMDRAPREPFGQGGTSHRGTLRDTLAESAGLCAASRLRVCRGRLAREADLAPVNSGPGARHDRGLPGHLSGVPAPESLSASQLTR